MKHRLSLYWPVLLVVAATTTGCSSDRVSAPLGPSTLTPLGEGCDGRMIGPSGGTLLAPGIELHVPAGALGRSVLMTIREFEGGIVELGPHGLQFGTPVSLSFEIPRGVDKARTSIRWFDPSTDTWTEIPSVATNSARVAPLAHFSKYEICIQPAAD